jgi:hypothetical protein
MTSTTEPVPPFDAPDELTAIRASIRARVAERRRSAESGGIIMDGEVFSTSSESRVSLLAYLAFAVRDPTYRTRVSMDDGSTRLTTAEEIYRLAVAVTNLMQTCAAWERTTLDAVDAAGDTDALATVETEVGETVPIGYTATPELPPGQPSPPLFKASMMAHNARGTGTMLADPKVSANNATLVRAGSFMWRRGDAQPTYVSVSCTCSKSDGKACVVVYEVGRRVTLGWAIAATDGDAIVRVPLANTHFVEDDDTAFEIEIHICNVGRKGSVELVGYLVQV